MREHIMKRILLILLACGISTHAYALTRGFSANSFIPAVDKGHYFTLYGSDTLKFGDFTEGSYVTYAYRSFQLASGNSRVRGILDHTLVQTFSFAFGLPDDHMQVGALVPVGWVLNFRDPSNANANGNNKMAIGDIELNFKTSIIDLDNHVAGFAVLPFLSLPTGRGTYFFGNGAISGGGRLILELKLADRFFVTFNPGVLVRNKFQFISVEYSSQLLLGLGASFQIKDNFAITGEISSYARLTAPFKHKYESPTEALAGVKWDVGKGWTLKAGAGGGIIYGSYVPLVRGFAGFSYSPPPMVIEVSE